MSKPCANCGAEIPDAAPFCDNCGMPVSEAAPPARKAQPPPTLPEESTPDRRGQLEQSERSPANLPDGVPDPYLGEQRRGAPGWAIWAAGLVGTAARRVPRWAIGAAAGLVAMMVARRQGADAVEENPTADSATQQGMGMVEAVAQDPAPIGEADADLVGDIAPAAAVTEPTGPTLDTGLVDQVEPSADLVNMVNRNPEPAKNPDVIDPVQQEPYVIDKLATTTAAQSPAEPETGEPPPAGPDAGGLPPAEPEAVRQRLAGPEMEGQPPVDDVGGPAPAGPEVGGPPAGVLPDVDLALFDRSVSRPTLDPGLLDEASPGPTLDAGLLDPNSPGPTVDANLLDPNASGATIDPALLDPNASGATIDPALLDPSAPGTTLDPNLLDPSAPGPTLDPNLLDPNAPGLTIDLDTLEQSLMEPGGDLGGVTEPDVPEPGPRDQDFDDTPNI